MDRKLAHDVEFVLYLAAKERLADAKIISARADGVDKANEFVNIFIYFLL